MPPIKFFHIHIIHDALNKQFENRVCILIVKEYIFERSFLSEKRNTIIPGENSKRVDSRYI